MNAVGKVAGVLVPGGEAPGNLKDKGDKGILGNGHFMMLENNRRQVFDAIRGWLETKIKNT